MRLGEEKRFRDKSKKNLDEIADEDVDVASHRMIRVAQEPGNGLVHLGAVRQHQTHDGWFVSFRCRQREKKHHGHMEGNGACLDKRHDRGQAAQGPRLHADALCL